MTNRIGITPRWISTGTGLSINGAAGDTLGEITVPFKVTYQGVVHALARAADIHAHVGDDADTFLTRRHTKTELMKMVRQRLYSEGVFAQDPVDVDSADLAWAQQQADRIWNGPKKGNNRP